MQNLTEWKTMNNSTTSNTTAQTSTKSSSPSISNKIKDYLDNFEKLAKHLESLGGWAVVGITSTRLEAYHAYGYFRDTLVIYYDSKYKAFTTTLEDTVNKRILMSVTCLDDWNTLLSILEREGIIKDKTLCENIENNKVIPEKLYHATYKQFIKSIQNKGLGNTKRKMWEDSKQGVVYLANDPWVAESYAEESEWVDEQEDPDKYLDNIITLEIDTSKLNADKFFTDENVRLEDDEENTTWEYHGIIPWEVCKIFNPSSDLTEDFGLHEKIITYKGDKKMSTNFAKEFKLFESLNSNTKKSIKSKASLKEGRSSAEIQAEIEKLQQELAQAKTAEKKASYGNNLPTVVYAWDIYLDPTEKGTWMSAELYNGEYDGFVFKTEESAVNSGWEHLNELDDEDELDYDVDDYQVDAVAIDVKKVSEDTLIDSGLEYLI